jgi:hypothetical protein
MLQFVDGQSEVYHNLLQAQGGKPIPGYTAAAGTSPQAAAAPPRARRAAAEKAAAATKRAIGALADAEDEDEGEDEPEAARVSRERSPPALRRRTPPPQRAHPMDVDVDMEEAAAPAPARQPARGAHAEEPEAAPRGGNIVDAIMADEQREKRTHGPAVRHGGEQAREENYERATSAQLAVRLKHRGVTSPGGVSPILAMHGVTGISPAAVEVLTKAVCNRLTGVLEGVHEQREWRHHLGFVAHAAPSSWVALPVDGGLQQKVWDIAAREKRTAEQKAAEAKAKQLATEEEALKRRKTTPGSAPLNAEEQARMERVTKMRAEQEAIAANAASTNAARRAIGGAAPGGAGAVADKWLTMERNAALNAAAAAARVAGGEAPGGGAGEQEQVREGGGDIRALGASREVPEVSVRDVATYLQRDPCATPRLLAVAAERLRRDEQVRWDDAMRRAQQGGPQQNHLPANQLPTAPLLKPLAPRLL